MAIQVSFQDGATMIAVDRVLDGDAASRLRALIRKQVAEGTGRVVVDLSRVQDVTPIALAALIDEHDYYRARVRFRGLSLHASRILAHLVARPTAVAS